MKKIIGIVLIVLAIYLGYVGVTKFSNSGHSVDVVGIELSTENNQEKSTAFIYLGFALLTFIGGTFLVRSKSS